MNKIFQKLLSEIFNVSLICYITGTLGDFQLIQDNVTTTTRMKLFKKEDVVGIYVLRGILLGLLFPIVSIIICLLVLEDESRHVTFVSLHKDFPLLWVIYTAPFVLGIVSYRVGSNVNKSASLYLAKIERVNIELNERNEELNILNKEKEVLLQEIHHRVKNNLQIVISLLNLQMNEIGPEEAKQPFRDAVNRILVISKIHRKLYQEDLLARVDILSYIKELAADLIEIYGQNDKIDVKVTSEIDYIELKTIMPLALIVNELLSNSIKYAFKSYPKGHIVIELIKTNEEMFNLIYSDDGVWIEQEAGESSFGLELLNILTEQLDGKMKKTISGAGTMYNFSLKKIDS